MKTQLPVSLMVVAAMMIGSYASASPSDIESDIAIIARGDSLMPKNPIVGFQAGAVAFVALGEKYYRELADLMRSANYVCDIGSDVIARKTFLANIDKKVNSYSAQLINLASRVVGNESVAGDKQRVSELKTAMRREMERSSMETLNPCSGK